jgi:hypothetical protein
MVASFHKKKHPNPIPWDPHSKYFGMGGFVIPPAWKFLAGNQNHVHKEKHYPVFEYKIPTIQIIEKKFYI